jgi:CheY-like chemotaxis protein
VPIKILLADDSMTAQKMGKEILISAGYEVVAVSNGAAAAKKLADKYGVIILDINMPGYTGFELCEKVRANMDIAKTPVLLTIGKMEHYEPTEAQRVKADGVIIKPFEATDLIATVQKLIEKSAPVPDYEKTVVMKKAQVEEFKDQSYNDWKQESEPEEAPKKNTIEMSHADASAPAFGMDMEEHIASAAPVESAPAMVPPAFSSAGFAAPTPIDDAAPAFEAPPVELAPVESARIETLMQPPPAFEEPKTIPIAPPTFSSTPARDPMFEAPSNESTGKISIPAKDPALAAHVEINSPEFVAKNAPEPPPSPSTDAEFEARVAAAMSTGYEEEHELVEAEPEEIPEPVEETSASSAMPQMPPPPMAEPPDYERTIKIQRPADLEISAQTATLASEVEIAPDPMIERSYEAPAPVTETFTAPAPEIEHHDAALVEQMHAAVQDMPVAPHVEEPMPEPAPVAQAAPAPVAPPSTTGHDLELANALAAAVGAEAPSAMAAAASTNSPRTTSVDHNVIAAAVQRAMTRMMPAILTEVAKELDPEKK